MEAHLSNQRMRLSCTEHGSRVLQKIGWKIELMPTPGLIPEHWLEKITSKPLPRNMTPGEDEGRRKARTAALERRFGDNSHVLYTDASLLQGCDRAAVAVTSRNRLITTASRRTRDPTTAEEVAMALALLQRGVGVVVTDSKEAYSSYRKGTISSLLGSTH